ncbi:hypothetical protein F0562_006042 [Nyssa sinensis]|uniref:Uncharacterized protein n=1 Tax=Nyssa sinensis TaxID=561372 RepID=A0A5J5AJY3_9ASTE|nr:hypothetical protein F0562_006042 [Nyssa sinensis]
MTLADLKVFMEVMLSEMRRVMRLELEQVHERIDQMEGAHERQPPNVPNLRRRERVQPREMRVEDEEPYGAGFDEEDDRDSVVAAKQHKSQGISMAASFNGSHLNKYHHAHGVSDSHAQGATTVSNFEDGEVYASTPVAVMPDSPARLTWADQASSGEFIPKEALDLEEEYGGFSVNSEFIFGQDNHFPEVSINEGYNTGGSKTGECRTRSKLATGKKPYSAVQPQQSRFLAIRKVTVQPPATTVAIQPHTQKADPVGGGALPHTHIVSSLGPRGTGPLVNPPQILLATDG